MVIPALNVVFLTEALRHFFVKFVRPFVLTISLGILLQEIGVDYILLVSPLLVVVLGSREQEFRVFLFFRSLVFGSFDHF